MLLLLGRLQISVCGLAGDAAERHNIGLSVAAEAVAAMDAARDFTGRKETRDRVTGRIKHLSLGIDLHAAHRVVNSRLNLDGKERGGLHGLRHIGTAERILARSFPAGTFIALAISATVLPLTARPIEM